MFGIDDAVEAIVGGTLDAAEDFGNRDSEEDEDEDKA